MDNIDYIRNLYCVINMINAHPKLHVIAVSVDSNCTRVQVYGVPAHVDVVRTTQTTNALTGEIVTHNYGHLGGVEVVWLTYSPAAPVADGGAA